MVLNKNMLEQVITIFSSDDILGSVVGNIDVLAGVFHKYLSGLSNLRMASIILMLLAFVLLLFLIIVLYVKSIIAFLKTDSSNAKKNRKGSDFIIEEMEEESNDVLSEQALERELEKELERDLEQSRLEKHSNEQKELERQNQRLEMHKKERDELENNLFAEKQGVEARNSSSVPIKKDFQLDLDWKKGKANEIENVARQISQEKMQYQQSNLELSELLGLVIDMLGRGVDDLKIAQTLMYRNQGQSSEDDIIQTIAALKDFVAMAINGKFAAVRKGKQLPDEATALYHLAEGDNTYALALLESLMDNNIERTMAMSSGAKRDEMFMETSNQAGTFGSLAAISDTHLATGAFELAIEMSPKNVNAWGRVADMYSRAGSHNQAIWAYQNVLNMADEEINISQVANANKMLSQYYYEQGNNLQAAKLYNSSKHYYDSLGISRRLDRQEIEIIEIIENRRREELGDTIAKILGNKDLRQYSYA